MVSMLWILRNGENKRQTVMKVMVVGYAYLIFWGRLMWKGS